MCWSRRDSCTLELLRRYRNLVPVLSLEGEQKQTDARRGAGVHQALMDAMAALRQAGLLFGVSITTTRENLTQVVSDSFVSVLEQQGCKAIIYVEYVPVGGQDNDLAPTPEDNAEMERRLMELRPRHKECVMISFPGDERHSGGCLAAGRGFFHINSHGGAEPCPFSAFSDSNVKTVGLKQALQSPLFQKLRTSGVLQEDHQGGCVLFENEAKVRKLVKKDKT